ncbi:MAG: tetratricopeptide repeat protein [Bacteroidales bacterium]|nr:tetratricopeptide repeat protein [Bacteroidales bacterium]
MKTRTAIFLLCLICLVATACGPSRDKELDTINRYEDSLVQQGLILNDALGKEMLRLYVQFANDFPTDSMSPLYLYRASDIASSLSMYDESLQYLNRIIDEYPEFEEASTCLFLKANVFENCMMLDSATQAYNDFLASFPDHPLAESARIALQYVGLSDEEMFRRIMANAPQGDEVPLP